MRAALSSPLNEYSCELCFAKLKRASSSQLWRWLNNLHGNAYVHSSVEETTYACHWTFQTYIFSGRITSYNYPFLLCRAAHWNTSQCHHSFVVSICIVIGCSTFQTIMSQGRVECRIVTRPTFAGHLQGAIAYETLLYHSAWYIRNGIVRGIEWKADAGNGDGIKQYTVLIASNTPNSRVHTCKW